MTRIIAVANQKGGVGKTTTSVNVAASLALSGGKVLLVDLDAQGNATMGCGIDKNEVDASVYEWLVEDQPMQEISQRCNGGFDVLPANLDLTAAEVQLMQMESREYVMRDRLHAQSGEYEYVIIDCPPSLSILTVNALIAAHGVLIPMQCEYYAMEGLVSLNKAINDINSKTGENIQISAILRTMFDPRARLTREVSEELQKYFPNELCSTVIPRNIKLAEAPSSGKPGLFYDPKAKGTVAYLALAGEVISKFEKDSMVA